MNIGPRGPTSTNEKRAAQYIEQIMKQGRIEVGVEEFKSLSSFEQIFYILIILEIVAATVFPWSILIAFLLSLTGLLFLMAELNLKPTVSRLLPKFPSQNIVRKIVPKGKSEKRVVLMGHYDSAFPRLFHHPKIARYSTIFSVAAFSSCLVITLLYGVALVFQALVQIGQFIVVLWCGSFPFLGYLALVSLGFVYTRLSAHPTNGANDNASGISVILGIAEKFSNEPLKNTEVWCVATGCEEAGTVGTINFLKRHAHELKDAYFFSVDCVGKGNLRYMVQEGLLTTIRVPTELIELVDEAASKISSEVEAKPATVRFHASDSFPVLKRGFKAMCILSFAENNLPANLHWKTDVYENIDVQTVKNAFKFVSQILKTIDAKP